MERMGANTAIIMMPVLDRPVLLLVLSSFPPPPLSPPLVDIVVEVTCIPATVPDRAVCKFCCCDIAALLPGAFVELTSMVMLTDPYTILNTVIALRLAWIALAAAVRYPK